jgi:anaphase-promoting complex subunit 4
LPADLLSASINPYPLAQSPPDDDAIDEANAESILAVADSDATLHLFLDGCFPLGSIALPSGSSVHSIYKHHQRPDFLVILQYHAQHSHLSTPLRPIQINIPILQDRMIRDFAKLSSTAKELAYFAYRVMQEMDRLYMENEFPDGGVGIVGKLWLDAIAEKHQDNSS